jgi:hypothetical protein
MTNANKIRVLALVTILISIPIITVNALPMRIVLGIIILGHYYLFIFRIKSVTKERLKEMIEEIGEREAARAAGAEEKALLPDENAENTEKASGVSGENDDEINGIKNDGISGEKDKPMLRKEDEKAV